MHKSKAILIGEYNHPKYHPLTNLDREVCQIFKEELEVTCTDDYEVLNIDNIIKYDLLICYADLWDNIMPKSQIAGLLSFVSNGGGLLVIHNGISFQKRYEFTHLLGAKFTAHPPMQKLKFTVTSPEHIIMQGINTFEIEDEPYQFEFDEFSEKTVLLNYTLDDNLIPAAWVKEFGLGRVVYLMPGHNEEAFKNPVYRELILRSGKWALKMI